VSGAHSEKFLCWLKQPMLAETTSTPASTSSTKKRAAPRKPWILSSEPVAKRLIPTHASRGGLSSAVRGGYRGGNLDRGGRGPGGMPRGRGGNFRGAGQPAHYNRGAANMPTMPAAAASTAEGAAISRLVKWACF
jgi:hypothetical protein